MQTGEPSPPAPMTSAWPASTRAWPSMPYSSSRMWREWRNRASSSTRADSSVLFLLVLVLDDDLGLADQHRRTLEAVERLHQREVLVGAELGHLAVLRRLLGFFLEALAG